MTLIDKIWLFLFPRTLYRSSDRELSVVDRIENGEPVRIFYSGKTRESGVYLDKDKRSTPLFKYMVMLKDICRKYKSLNNGLMIGGGGLVFAEVFLSLSKTGKMTAVEMDPRCIDIAKQYFGISPGERLKIECMPGEQYITRAAEHNAGVPDNRKILFDFVLYDAYVGDRMAKGITTESMLKMVKTIMTPGGILALNMINDPGGKISMQTYLIEQYLKEIFFYTYILRCENGGNSILLATDRAERSLRIPENTNTRIL